MKPARGFEPRTPSLRESRGVCGWLQSVALTAAVAEDDRLSRR
jgi:hypothetical protein